MFIKALIGNVPILLYTYICLFMKTVIDNSRRSRLDLSEIKRYAGLMKNLARRDVTVRYKQTWMGMIWAMIRPIMNITIFGVLSMFINHSEDPASDFLKVGAGIVIWNLITSCISDSSGSLLANANLLTKVYFPKIILPVSSVFVCLVDFAIAFVIYLICFLFFHGLPGPQIFLLPVFVLLAVFFCLSIGFIFSSLNVKYRDVNFALPFILQFAFYLSPVFLSTQFYLDKLPVSLHKLFLLNPAVLILDGFRYCLFGTWEVFDPICSGISVLIMIVLFVFGIRYFQKFEKAFADFI